MGLYCEPQEEKALWITQFPQMLGTKFESAPKDKLPVVCLWQNFVSLGVAYNHKEFKRFLQGRPDGVWYLVPKEVLRKVVPGAAKMKEFK